MCVCIVPNELQCVDRLWTPKYHIKSQPMHNIPIINNSEQIFALNVHSFGLSWRIMHGGPPTASVCVCATVYEVAYVCRSSVTRNRYTHSSTTIFVPTVTAVVRTSNCNYPIWRFIKYLPASTIIKICAYFRRCFCFSNALCAGCMFVCVTRSNLPMQPELSNNGTVIADC